MNSLQPFQYVLIGIVLGLLPSVAVLLATRPSARDDKQPQILQATFLP